MEQWDLSTGNFGPIRFFAGLWSVAGFFIWKFSLYLYLHLLEEEMVVLTEANGENLYSNLQTCQQVRKLGTEVQKLTF